MRKTNRAEFWAVHRRSWTVRRKVVPSTAVCEQGEWAARDLAELGVHTLVRGRNRSEEEAEQLARGTSGDAYRSSPRNYSTKMARS
jgi:hypothetical protein